MSKNFKEFVKEYKKEIIIGAAAALTGGVAGYLLNGKLSDRYISKMLGGH